MSYAADQIIKALQGAGVHGADRLVERYGCRRVVEVGQAYRMATHDGAASGPGWIIQALRDDWDVTYYLDLWREAEEAGAQYAYLVKQGTEAEQRIKDFDEVHPDRPRLTRAERLKPLTDFLQMPKGNTAEQKTCLVCEEDPCRCPAEAVYERARTRARLLLPLIEEEEAARRRARYLRRRAERGENPFAVDQAIAAHG